jgi:glyoxylase-like metal-dependent hydrolase (beta-lactamase superfamily II)
LPGLTPIAWPPPCSTAASTSTIVITHDHPDHFFGLDVLADAFPDARIVANPVAARDMRAPS